MTSVIPYAARHTPDFAGYTANPKAPACALSYRIEVVGHGKKISNQILITDGRKALVAASSILWKLNNVIRAICHVCFSKRLGNFSPRHAHNMTKEPVKCLSLKMTELFRRAPVGVNAP